MTSLAKTLYDFAKIMEQIEENDGVVSDEILPAFTHVELAVAQKIDAYVGFYNVVEAQIDKAKKTVDVFKKQLKSLESLKDRLKDKAKEVMQVHDLKSLHGHARQIKLVNSGGVEAMDLPEDFFEEIRVINPKYVGEFLDMETNSLYKLFNARHIWIINNKQKFREAVARGDIPGCSIRERSKYVRFV